MSIASQLGPRPEGSPGATRGVAMKLLRAAAEIEKAAAPVLDLISPDAFRGPARSNLDAGFRSVQSRGRAAAAALEQEAARLAHDATKLEEAIKGWERRREQLIEAEARDRAAREQAAREQAAGR